MSRRRALTSARARKPTRFSGLKTSSDADVLNDAGRPIGGLYAVGNDAASVMGGNYPGGGITLGPAITFGYIAVRHMSGANE